MSLYPAYLLSASAGIATLDVASLVRLHGLGVWSRLIAIGPNLALPLSKDKVRMGVKMRIGIT